MRRLVASLALLILVASAYALGWSNLFVVKKIVIGEGDRKIAQEIKDQLSNPSPVVEVGRPIARVDKRAISARLRRLIWVDSVDINRNLFTGEISISVKTRSAIARLASDQSSKPELIRFMDANLEIFSIPIAEVDRAARSGEQNWMALPELSLGGQSRSLREDVARLISFLKSVPAQIEIITANDSESFRTRLSFDGRDLDISWGNVNDLPLKAEVLRNLLQRKENKRVIKIDLSSPLTPVVR